MTDIDERIIIPAEEEGKVCVINEVHYNAIESRVSLVTNGSRRPALKATVDHVTGILPDVITIRVMNSGTFDLSTLCTFKVIDGEWQMHSPRLQSSRSLPNKQELHKLLNACLVAAIR